MYCNGKLFVAAPTAVLILILCVLSTDQTLFSRKKHFPAAASTVDGSHQAAAAASIPQKETSHWWQMKHKPEPSDTTAGPNQVTGAAVPLVDIHQKLQSILESHVNSDVKWVPCLCPVRKTEFHQHLQQQQQQPQQQPQKQPPQQQQQHKQPHSSYYPTTQAPSGIVNNVPRFIFANYQIEE